MCLGDFSGVLVELESCHVDQRTEEAVGWSLQHAYCLHFYRCVLWAAGCTVQLLCALLQASAMRPLLRLLLLALGLGLTQPLNSNDPNVCTFWER